MSSAGLTTSMSGFAATMTIVAMLHAIHTLSWIMAVVPAAAIVVALVLFRRSPAPGAKPSEGQANS